MRRAMDSIGHPALLLVDAVSSLGSIDFRMDEWKVDVVRLRLAEGPDAARRPGRYLRQREGAGGAAHNAKQARCYFDYLDMLNQNKNGYFPYTPALPMLYGLKEVAAGDRRRKAWRTSSSATPTWPAACAPRCTRAGG